MQVANKSSIAAAAAAIEPRVRNPTGNGENEKERGGRFAARDNKMAVDERERGQRRTASRYKPINKMIRSRCNDVSNKIRGKLQTTPSQFSFIPV